MENVYARNFWPNLMLCIKIIISNQYCIKIQYLLLYTFVLYIQNNETIQCVVIQIICQYLNQSIIAIKPTFNKNFSVLARKTGI